MGRSPRESQEAQGGGAGNGRNRTRVGDTVDAERRRGTKSGKKVLASPNRAFGFCFPIDFEWPWDFQVEKRLSLDREFQRQRDVILSSLFFLLAPSGSLTIDDFSAKRPETLFLTFCKQL